MSSELPSRSDLGGLADPARHTEPLDVRGRDRDGLTAQLRMMLLVRRVEERIGDLVVDGLLRTPCHLGIGQEAIAAGISAYLRKSDRIFGAHRSHAHYLALGGSVERLIAEVFGKESGCSRGMGGSMHLYGAEVGFIGSVPIVSGTVPVAVGAGLAAKLDGRGDVSVAYFGDGAAEEGGVHESLNLAVSQRIPTLFVCENNLFSSHLDIHLRQPSDRIARFADAHRIPARVVDGNDLLAVGEAARELIEAARNGEGPQFLETVTYRWRGHVGPNEDQDVGVRRRPEDIAAWKRRDPVARLTAGMQAASMIDEAALEAMRRSVEEEVERAVEAAKAAPYPPPEALLDRVYAQEVAP